MRVLGLTALLALSACASDPSKDAPEMHLSANEVEDAGVVLSEEVRVKVGRRKLDIPAGAWRLMGDLPAGQAYKPVDDVLILNRTHSYEAYLVLSDSSIVGVYLPYEKRFIATESPTPIVLSGF